MKHEKHEKHEKKGHHLDFLKKVWQLTTLQISPEALPYTGRHLVLGIALNLLLSYLVAISLPVTELKSWLSPMLAIEMKSVNLFFLAFFLYLILKLTHKTNRFFKLFLAIIMGTLMIESINFMLSLIPSIIKTDFFTMLFTLIIYITIAWMFVFIGHVFRFGLEVSRFKAIGIGIGYILISGIVSMMIFGNPFEEIV